jgi:uncharacterized protein (DUF2252 family)
MEPFSMRDPVVEFQNFNRAFARRNPELLRLKIARMAASPFAFFRGTFHLFARDILDKVCEPPTAGGRAETEVDLVGDLHTENFGTFDGADGIVHYDINDFDETTRGRFDFDVRRQVASLILAGYERGDHLGDAVAAAVAFLGRYTELVTRLLKKGRDLDFDISEKSPGGPAVDQLVRTAAANKRAAFIEKLTTYADGGRQLVRSTHYFNLPDDERQQALRLLEDYSRRMPPRPEPDFYDVEDVCGRVSGIGSMGRLRYVVLIAGKGTREARNRLIEFKEARPSAYDLYRNRDTDAAALAARAERVITMQRASQAASNPWLGFALDRNGGGSFQVRELGPRDARLDWKALKGLAEVQDAARAQAGILARTHARAAARVVGVANPLAELGDAEAFCRRTLAFALAYADLAQQDWSRFVGRRADLEHCEDWAAAAL